MDSIKSFIRKRLELSCADYKPNKKKLILSVVSLVLAAVTLTSATYCWYALTNAEGRGSNIAFNAGNGLRVNDLGDTFKHISDNSYLLPASSVDGRNLFFPTDGTDFSSTTADMTFRSANAGDRNYDYVQLDFELTAEANYTGIFLSKDTAITIDAPDDSSQDYKDACKRAEKAIRAAIYYEGMDAPAVFNCQSNPSSVQAVKDIDRATGHFRESARQVAVPFKDYSYGKRQLAMLNQGETRPFSLIIWLEGTDDNCVSKDGSIHYVDLKQLKLNLKFTTSWDNTTTIKFTDNTTGTGVVNLLNSNPQYSLVLDYTNNSHKISGLKFNMYKSATGNDNTTWYCNIPDNAFNDLTFMIIDDSNNGSVVRKWSQNSSGGSTLNRGTANHYYADTIINSADSSAGHWYDGDIEQQGNGYDIGEIDDNDW